MVPLDISCSFVKHTESIVLRTIDGEYAIGLFASRDIPAFEELVYDYNFEWYNAEQQQECFCGSSKCRGFISRRNAAEDRDKERQLRRETVQTAQKGKKQKGRKKKEESSEEVFFFSQHDSTSLDSFLSGMGAVGQVSQVVRC